MEFRTHWIVDDFSPDAQHMRQRIDEHFDEQLGKKMDFAKRAIWNYWYVDTLYTYLRANPDSVFPSLYQLFLTRLKDYCAVNFGLDPGRGYLSMYIDGCGQNIHNDAKNGRLAYVYSLTKWNERHFDGGETIIYKLGEGAYANTFRASAGTGFYEMVPPVFNRLLLFDDRMPHAVRPIHGTMKPEDARFVMHGHLRELPRIGYIEGGLRGADLSSQWQQMSEPVSRMLQSHEQHGFITYELVVNAASTKYALTIRHVQLLPTSRNSKDISVCLDDAKEILSRVRWPATEHPTRMVFALHSGAL